MEIESKIAELIRKTSSTLPDDALKALKAAMRREEKGSSARMVLKTLVDNAALAARNGTPMCQDTGTLTFFVDERLRASVTSAVVKRAVAQATRKGGKNPTVTLLMKGGGSENMSRQYSLPDASLGAGRDLEGVRRCILDAVHKAQGYGCAPGILGVCVGGDRAGGYEEAKHQLLRKLDDRNCCDELARLERRVLKEANALGIGPMGLGGRTTLLGVKIGSRPRVPASFFVTVAYLCWAARRGTVEC